MHRRLEEPESPGATLQLSLAPGHVIESWRDPEIRAYFRDSYRRHVPPATSLSVEAHQPDVLRAFARFWWATFHRGELEPGLKERLRVRVAEAAGCAYCATSRTELGPDHVDGTTPVVKRGDGVAWSFAVTFATRPWELGPSDWACLGDVFGEGAVAEFACFLAWQFGGPRVIRSWGAAAYKPDARIEPATLPVRLAYLDEAGLPPEWPAVPDVDAGGIAARARAEGSPPAAWLDVLAARPDLLAAWTGLYAATVHGRTLPPRIGTLIRLDLARLLVSDAWAERPSPAFAALALDDLALDRLAALDPVALAPDERLALAYARAVASDAPMDDGLVAQLRRRFSEAQLVELGFAVAVQLGPALLVRSLRAPEGLVMSDTGAEHRYGARGGAASSSTGSR